MGRLKRTETLGNIIADLGLKWPDMTEEQWREHDARVKHSLEASERAFVVPPNQRGWPARALQSLALLDLGAEAVRALRRPDLHGITIISGVPGCGKTVAAAWWATHRQRDAWFVHASELARTSRYREQLWRDVKALCIDDLGAEYLDKSGSFLVDLDELINSHYADARPLVVTTNCTWRQFVERYGARIEDRLRECAAWVEISEGSRREPRARPEPPRPAPPEHQQQRMPWEDD